jgi:hypothetical protein
VADAKDTNRTLAFFEGEHAVGFLSPFCASIGHGRSFWTEKLPRPFTWDQCREAIKEKAEELKGLLRWLNSASKPTPPQANKVRKVTGVLVAVEELLDKIRFKELARERESSRVATEPAA